jgi:hypothetical protein
MKNLLLILLATLFVACNEGTRYDEPDAPVTLVETTVDVIPDNEHWKPRCEYSDSKFTIVKNQTLEGYAYNENFIALLPLSAISNEKIFVDEVRIYLSSDYSADQNKYIGTKKDIADVMIDDKGILYLNPQCSGTYDILIIWEVLDK